MEQTYRGYRYLSTMAIEITETSTLSCGYAEGEETVRRHSWGRAGDSERFGAGGFVRLDGKRYKTRANLLDSVNSSDFCSVFLAARPRAPGAPRLGYMSLVSSSLCSNQWLRRITGRRSTSPRRSAGTAKARSLASSIQ